MEVELIILSVADLGFHEAATTREVIGTDHDTDEHGNSAPFTGGRAGQLGLELCPSEVGPAHRLQYQSQPLGERLYVAMKPIPTPDGAPRIFVLVHKPNGLYLDGVRARPDDKWHPSTRFIFKLPTAAR